MKYHSLSIDDVFYKLNSNRDGLSIVEANSRLKSNGKNILKEKKGKPIVIKFLEQFKDLMIIVLIIASILSFVISYINNESYLDSIIILAIVVINAIIGFVQEIRADKAIDALKSMQVSKVKVKRDDEIHVVDSADIVKGDILVLEAGDTIPADARIVWSASLKVDESALTGESIAIEKDVKTIKDDTPLSERSNMIYQGTSIVYGKCEAVVCATSFDTEFGKIASSLNEAEEKLTPVQVKINSISKVLSIIIAVIIIIMLIIGVIKDMKTIDVIMLSISLAVAAIPEGLPAVITVVLSIGMTDLAKKKAIVRKMSSVETLGSTEIICSDKTGTITKNKMTVQEYVYDKKVCKAGSINDRQLLSKIMILNNDAVHSDGSYIGDPTEIALLECFTEEYVSTTRENNERIGELPFDSNRKMMSTINKCADGVYLFVKGSFDSVISKCSYYYNDKEIKLTNNDKDLLLKLEQEESSKAYRVLTFAYKKLENKYIVNEKLENDLVFVCMVSMIDPPRDDVKESITLCKNAHIRPIMITGDGVTTAKAIAKNVGIITKDSEVVTGSDIDKMGYDSLKRNIDKYSVYARVSPMNKLDIVNAWRENGKVVAMTGDGVNDAPALKTADIGVGMGISGTEVSKSVSDIILTDDSFSSIVTAVREGRRIFDNIRNVLVYLLVGNIAEVIVVFIGMAIGINIFSPIQLLYINLITDSIPAIALAFEKESDDIMKRKVRRNDKTFFTPFLVSKIAVSAIIKTITMLFVFAINYRYYGALSASTVTFLTLVLLEMSYAFSCKNLKKNIIGKHMFNNSFMNISLFVLLLFQILVFATPIGIIFGIGSLTALQVIHSVVIVALMFTVDELLKVVIVSKFSD